MQEQDEWARWTAAEAARRQGVPSPTAAAMLGVVLVCIAAEIGRAGLDPAELERLARQVGERLGGR